MGSKMEMRTGLIRVATAADIDALVALERRCYDFPWSRQQFAEELANPAATIELLLIDGVLGGYSCCWFICGELQIQNLATSPDFRRCGIARRLLEHVIARCCLDGLTSAWLEVREDNQAAIKLYQCCGFEVQGRRKKYYQDGADALLLSRHFD